MCMIYLKKHTLVKDIFHRINQLGVQYMGKKTYYVNIGTHEISQIPYGENAMYTIEADEMEVFELRKRFNAINDAEVGTYIRSHIPFVPYHKDGENDAYDKGLHEAIQMIYQLGVEKTKKDLEELGLYKDK